MMMATGYVHPVADGKITTLRDFALNCSWAMMALVTMRDDAHDGDPPRELQPSLEYAEGRLAEAQDRLNKLAAMTEAERTAFIDAEYELELAGAREFDEKSKIEVARCIAMRAQVASWQDAPDGLKRFMLEQLDRSLDGAGDYSAAAHVKRRDFEDVWRRAIEAVGRAHGDIEREKALATSRNVWLKQLWTAIDNLPAELAP